MKLLLQLYFSFFKIGLFTIGGGLSMLPMLEREVVVRRRWVTKEEILDFYAVGQCTPGVIAVDVSAFVGYRCKKALGAILAPFAVISPGFGVMLLLASVLQRLSSFPAFQSAFAGMRVALCALIAANVWRLLRESVKNPWQLALAVAAFLTVALFGASPAWAVLGAGLLGLVRVKKRA
jgi:chromate transporter